MHFFTIAVLHLLQLIKKNPKINGTYDKWSKAENVCKYSVGSKHYATVTCNIILELIPAHPLKYSAIGIFILGY